MLPRGVPASEGGASPPVRTRISHVALMPVMAPISPHCGPACCPNSAAQVVCLIVVCGLKERYIIFMGVMPLHPLLLDAGCHHKLDISSSSPGCDHNLYAGPCPLDSCRNSVHNSGLIMQFAWKRRHSMIFTQILLTGLGYHLLRAEGAVRNYA